MGMHMTKFDFGDKVLLKQAGIEARITSIAIRATTIFEVTYFNDRIPATYWAYDWELELIESASTTVDS